MCQQMASQPGTDPFPLPALSVYEFRERDDMLFAYLSDSVNVTSV
jgi:clorobiocin/coumermycin A biosynthesis protein CloN6/CouN6